MEINILDYGMGNLRSIAKAIEKIGYPTRLISTAQEIEESQKLILPGVGAFGKAMENLKQNQLIPALKKYAADNRPLLGICLGLQLLFEKSTEKGEQIGLGIFEGRVTAFDLPKLSIPHMGWNQVSIHKPEVFRDLPANPYFYFVHSFYAVPEDPALLAASCDYGLPFCAAVQSGNIRAFQFHPEKSGLAGLQLLKNFCE